MTEKIYFQDHKPGQGDRVRYVITKLDNQGMRVLGFPNQGRFHFDTKEEAEKVTETIRDSNSTLLQKYFPKVKVVAAMCWHHGDCKGTVFEYEGDNPEFIKFLKELEKGNTEYQPANGKLG